MSRDNRYASGAIGFVIGLGLAILFLVWSFPGFRNPTYQQDIYQYAKNIKAGEAKPVVRPSIWEIYTSPTDTYAQWIMAALSLVATGVSVWAVWLVRSTLDENRKATRAAEAAVAEARRIGEAQVRAYINIYVRNISSFDVGMMPFVDIVVKNAGQSPAINVRRNVLVRIIDHPIQIPDEAFGLAPDQNSQGVIAVGGDLHVFLHSEAITNEQLVAIQQRNASICVFAIVEYETVFNTKHVERAAYVAVPDDDSIIKWTSNRKEADQTINFTIIEPYVMST